jgi:pimeloyl-ACP methyl ester carboxylesterase
MAEREVRYCTTEDGVSIAYSVTGQGPPLLFMQPGPSHLELAWRTPRYGDLLEWLSTENSLILVDWRGSGMSQREKYELNFDLDYAGVISAVGVDRLILFAMSGGGPYAIRLAATRPELVERLVLWNTWAAPSIPLRDPRMGAILPMVSTDWVTFTEALVAALSGWQEPEAARAYAAMMREAITQSAWLRAMEVTSREDVSKLLPAIQAETLVVNDPAAIHPDTAKQLMAGIPNARLRVLEGSSIMVSLDDPKIEPWLRAFLDGKEAPDDAGPPASAASAALRTVLFTDLVGSH